MNIFAELKLNDCDKTVVAIGALLHDIGKTYEAPEEELIAGHKVLGYTVSKDFLTALPLTPTQQQKLRDILSDEGESNEQKLIHDADRIAFFPDAKL